MFWVPSLRSLSFARAGRRQRQHRATDASLALASVPCDK